MISVVFDIPFSGSSWPETVMASKHSPTAAAANETDVILLLLLDKVVLVLDIQLLLCLYLVKLRCVSMRTRPRSMIFFFRYGKQKNGIIIIIIINDYINRLNFIIHSSAETIIYIYMCTYIYLSNMRLKVPSSIYI